MTAVPAISPPRAPAWLDQREYPFTSRWMTLPSGDRIHYVDEGTGPAVLFVHGTPTWSFEWRHLIRALAPSHRCIALDHLGFGLSDRPAAASYGPEAHAERLRQFVDQLGLTDFTLVVHDFGGVIGLPLAVEDPARVRRLVVINSWMWHLGDDPAVRRIGRLFGGALGRLLYERLNFSLRVIMPGAYADRSRLPANVHAQYLAPFTVPRDRGTVLWPLARSLGRPSSHAERLWERRGNLAGMPALIVWGMKDPAVKPNQLERWRAALPHAEVVEVDAGHWPHEEAPDAVGASVTAFLAR